MILRQRGYHDPLQRGLAVLEILCHRWFKQEIHRVLLLGLSEDWFEHVGNVISLDDATGTPNLQDLIVIDIPVVLAVGLVDDIDSLNVRGEAACVRSDSKILEEGGFVLDIKLLGREVGPEGLLSAFTLIAVCRGET